MKTQNRTETGYVEVDWQDNTMVITRKPFTATELVESTPTRNIHSKLPTGLKIGKNEVIESRCNNQLNQKKCLVKRFCQKRKASCLQ